MQLFRRPLRDDFAPLASGFRPEIEDIVGRLDDLPVMLDHEDRIAQVAELADRADQPAVIARMESDRRLVEDVKHAGQAAADLRRQADPLRLAAREGRRRPCQGQVAEPDVGEELEPFADFAYQFAGDLLFPFRELLLFEEGEQVVERPAADLVDRQVVEPDRGGVVAQAASHAGGALDLFHLEREAAAERGDQAGGLVDCGIEPLVLEPEEDRRGRFPPGGLSGGIHVVGGQGEPAVAGPVEEEAAVPRVHLLERLVGGDPRLPAERVQKTGGLRRAGFGPEVERPLAQRAFRLLDHMALAHADFGAEPLAVGAPAERAVERKVVRRQAFEAPPAFGAGEMLAERDFVFAVLLRKAVGQADEAEFAAAEIERGLDAPRQAASDAAEPLVGGIAPRERPGVAGRQDDAVGDHLDLMAAVPVNVGNLVEPEHAAVDPHAEEPQLPELFPESGVVARLGRNRRGDQGRPLVEQGGHLVDDLVGRLRSDGHVAVGAVRHAEPREEDAQIVVYLGDRADGRPGGMNPRLLLYGDRGRNTDHLIDVRLGHLAQELARVTRKGLDEPALPLGVDGIHRQRGLAAAAHSGTDGDPLARYVERDVLQVVLPRAADEDRRLRGFGFGAVRRGGRPLSPFRLFERGAVFRQMFAERAPGQGFGAGHDLFGRSRRDDAAPRLAPFGPEIDDPVGGLDDVEVVFHDQDGVPLVDETAQDVQEHPYIGEMKSRGRLVEQIEGPAGRLFHQLARQLDPLRLAAGKGRRRLAELHVAEPDVPQGPELVRDLREVREQDERLVHVHFEDVVDRMALERHAERVAVEPLPPADGAFDPDVGEEIHFELLRAVPLARLAAAAGDVEAEPARLKPLGARFRQIGEKPADVVEEFDIRRGVRAGRPPDRRLVDRDHLVEMPDPLDGAAGAGIADPAVQVAVQDFGQDVVDQRALAAAADTRHTDHAPERNLDVDVLEVVLRRAPDHQLFAGRLLARRGNRDRFRAVQEPRGQAGLFRRKDVGDRSLRDDLPPFDAGAGPEIDEPVGGEHRLFVMLDHDHRVADIAQAAERFDQFEVVARVQADRRLVEDVEDAGQAASDLARQADPLYFTPRKGRCGTAERKVGEPDVAQESEPGEDLFQRLAGDLPFGLAENDVFEEFDQPGYRQGAEVGERQARTAAERLGAGRRVEAVGARLVVEPPSAAVGAPGDRHVLFHRLALGLAPRLVVLLEHHRNDALEPVGPAVPAGNPFPGIGDLHVGVAVEEELAVFRPELLPGGFEDVVLVEPVPFRDGVGNALEDVPDPFPHVAPPAERLDAPLLERAGRVGDQEFLVERFRISLAGAVGAHPLPAVEAEKLRGRRRKADSAVGAGVFGAEQDLARRLALFRARGGAPFPRGRSAFGGPRPGFEEDDHFAFPRRHRRLDRLGQPVVVHLGLDDPVDHHVDRVALLPVDPKVVFEADEGAVDPRAEIAALFQVAEQVAELPLLPLDHRGEDQKHAVFGKRDEPVENLAAGLCRDRAAALRAVAGRHAREEETEKIVNLGHRPDGRPRILPARFL